MHIYSTLPRLLEGVPSPVILEIGAHYGEDTVELRHLFPQCRMWMFEPDPRNVYKLRKNGIDKAAKLVEAAVGAEDGHAEFILSSASHPKATALPAGAAERPVSASSSLKKPVKHLEMAPWVKFDTKVKVKVVTLDTFAATEGLAAIDFIWADVQGAEDQMIAGGQKALATTSYLYTEYSDVEVYQGQINLKQIVERLPGKWEVLEDFGDDVLLRNVTKLGAGGSA